MSRPIFQQIIDIPASPRDSAARALDAGMGAEASSPRARPAASRLPARLDAIDEFLIRKRHLQIAGLLALLVAIEANSGPDGCLLAQIDFQHI